MTKKLELYAIFRNGRFVEAAVCPHDDGLYAADRYIRSCERKYGLLGFSYRFGKAAKAKVPKTYKPRLWVPRMSRVDFDYSKYAAMVK